jgi:hypothetical protein
MHLRSTLEPPLAIDPANRTVTAVITTLVRAFSAVTIGSCA